MTLSFLIILFLSPLPSLIWLLIFLAQEKEKEPKKKIFEIFLWGAIFAILLGFLMYFSFKDALLNFDFKQRLDFFFPFLEEFVKFLPFYFFVKNSRFFNKPEDGMVYMITSALGFAAIENFFASFSVPFEQYFSLLILRTLTATFLHALCSGFFGYFLALYYFQEKNLLKPIFGFSIASFFHLIYNILLNQQKVFYFGIAVFYLLILAFLNYFLFKRLWKAS